MKKGTFVSDVPEVKKQWNLAFDIKPEGKLSKYGSIVHLTTKANCCKEGYRIPGVWFLPNSLKLLVCVAKDGNGNRCIRSKSELKRGEYSNILVEQKLVGTKYKVTLTINGEVDGNPLIHTNEPKEFQNVKMYSADPWYDAAVAYVRNLAFDNVGK